MMSEEYASDAQIKRLYAVLHSLKLDPKEWKKEQGFGNYAKLLPHQCSEYIDDLEELEATKKREAKKDIENDTQKQADATPSGYTQNGMQQQAAAPSDLEVEMLHLEVLMQLSMRAANSIVDREITNCGADSTAALIKQKTAVTIFTEAAKRGL